MLKVVLVSFLGIKKTNKKEIILMEAIMSGSNTQESQRLGYNNPKTTNNKTTTGDNKTNKGLNSANR